VRVLVTGHRARPFSSLIVGGILSKSSAHTRRLSSLAGGLVLSATLMVSPSFSISRSMVASYEERKPNQTSGHSGGGNDETLTPFVPEYAGSGRRIVRVEVRYSGEDSQPYSVVLVTLTLTFSG
jgi:hypothetical protein